MITPDTQPISPIHAHHILRRPPRRRSAPLIIGGVLAALLACTLTAGLLFAAALMLRTTSVTLLIDGQPVALTSRARTVGEAVAPYIPDPAPGDRVSPPPDTPLTADMTIRIDRARPVTVTMNDVPRTVWTTASLPVDILAAAGLYPTENDALWIDGSPARVDQLAGWTTPARHVRVQTAATLTLQADGATLSLTTTAATLGDALYEAGITMYAADTALLNGQPAALNAPIPVGAVIDVQRGAIVRIEADGRVIEARAGSATTVGDALAEAGIALVGLDYTIPGEGTALIPGITVRVMRVKEAVVVQDAEIAYERIVQADPALEIDNTAVSQAGRPGTQRTAIRIRYENGIEVGRETGASYVLTPPQTEVVTYGTNVVIRTVDTPAGPVEYWRTFRVYATSYHPAALGGDNVTATGRILQRGIVGADPDLLPYGTNVYVENYGTGIIADTGMPRHSTRWIDLGYSDEDWRNWHWWVTIYLLTPVPAEIDYFPPP